MNSTRAARLAALLLSGTLGLTACGGDSSDGAKATTPAAPASATVKDSSPAGATASSSAAAAASSEPAAAAASPSSAEEGDCSEAVMEVKSALASAGDTVTGVKDIGQCAGISISTTLTADAEGSKTAKALCTTAGVQAFAKGVGSVSVDAKDGTEIAIGIKDAKCIGPFG